MPITPEQKKEVLAKVAEASVIAEQATDCPAELSAAQCILETGWLQHYPKDSNNVFGIKDTDRYPGAVYVFTKEFENGEYVTKKLAFESYPTLAECFIDHGKLLTGGFDPRRPNCYAEAFEDYADGLDDLEAFARRIAKFYATDPAYADLIIKLMRMDSLVEAIAAARANLTKGD